MYIVCIVYILSGQIKHEYLHDTKNFILNVDARYM